MPGYAGVCRGMPGSKGGLHPSGERSGDRGAAFEEGDANFELVRSLPDTNSIKQL